MEHKREMRLMLSRTGVLVVGVTSIARERERELGLPACLPLCVRVSLSPRPCIVSTSPRVNVRQCERFLPPPPRKALDTPFYRYKEMTSCTMGCSYVLTWLAEKRLEPYTRANVAVGEVP
jgi:hypothetical protein